MVTARMIKTFHQLAARACSNTNTMAFLGLKVLLVVFLACEARGLRQLQQILHDDFNDFNLSLWKHEITLTGGGNWEFEYYANNRSNSYVSGGALYIKPTLLADQIGDANVMGNNFNLDVWGGSPADACTGNFDYGCFRTAGAGGNYLNPIVSARIRTAESFSFTYGKVEVRAKLPRGDWLWPAIWMLPTDNQYGGWPASGEIDIMESRGNSPGYPPGGYDTFGSTLHFGPYYTEDPWYKAHQSLSGVDLTADYHIYGLIWNETYMGTYFDNESTPVLSFPINQSFWTLGGWMTPPWNNPWNERGNNAPFDRRYYLIINVACGGMTGYFPDGVANKPWSNTDSHSVNSFYNNKSQWYPTWTAPMAVDSVTVWTYVEGEDRPERVKASDLRTEKGRVHAHHKIEGGVPPLVRKSGISVGHPERKVTFDADHQQQRRL